MRKILLLFICVVLFQGLTKAQFTDNFNDGDFTSNPTWTGDDALYKVNSSFQLQLNSTGTGIATLSAANTMLPEMEWSFWIKLAFAPSDNNLARVYLASDQADLKGPLNGYYIKLGETGALDAIELVQQSGNIHTVICRGIDGLLAASFAIRIKVIRSAGGSWTLYADELGGTNYQLQATGTDNTYISGSHLGVYSKYTSSNVTNFYYDNFYAGVPVVDNTPPVVVSVSLTSPKQLLVTFSEPVESATATSVNNYSVTPGNILPSSVTQDISNPAIVQLTFSQNFTPDVPYTLTTSNVRDLAGNTMIPGQSAFSWHQAKTYDILINEIMADPTPAVNLPDAEYIELYNRSALPVDIKNWVLVLGSSSKIFPQYTLPAGGYVILCSTTNKPLLQPFGNVIDFSSFSVTNLSGTLTLKDYSGKIVHTVSYVEGWFNGSYKKDGGWSLELVDPMNPCGEASNWKACTNAAGGTPGSINSVNAPNPDLIPPAITRVGITDPTHITVWFSESCDSVNILNTANYSIDNGVGYPVLAASQSPDYRQAKLTLSSPLSEGIIYTLTSTRDIIDCAGNQLLSGTSARFAIPVAVAANDIVINELLYDSPTGCVDFVEIYNRSSKVIDLKELLLVNYDTIFQTPQNFNEISKQPFLMFPGDYYALSTDSANIKSFYKTTSPQSFINMSGYPSMNNDNGVVALTTKGGVVIDLVRYTSSMQYPLLKIVDGVSLERISPDRPSKETTNWHSASESVGYATPGYKNSQFGIMINDENEIALSPAIFSPDNDGYNDFLTIAYAFGAPGNNLTITIYDASGRLVRNLVNHELCGTSGAYTWDGINNDRRKAMIGRYIVFIEIFDMQGRVKQYKRTTVLGGKI